MSVSAQHWQNFVSSSPRFDSANLPVHAVEYERKRRKQESWKSIFCCLKMLVGKSPRTNNTADVRRRQSRPSNVALLRSTNTDDSFGYNFDEQHQNQPPPQLSVSSEESSDHID